jgi:hypothetical protein
MDTVPKGLRSWFVAHFAADMAFALPLLLVPREFLTLLGWTSVDPFAARLVAAALFGIGGESFLSRKASAAAYKAMLRLKLIWSGSALLGMSLTLVQFPAYRLPSSYLLVIVFALFNALWLYWLRRLNRA